jgi:hypothetical protein
VGASLPGAADRGDAWRSEYQTPERETGGERQEQCAVLPLHRLSPPLSADPPSFGEGARSPGCVGPVKISIPRILALKTGQGKRFRPGLPGEFLRQAMLVVRIASRRWHPAPL